VKEREALLARDVARAAAAWLNAPVDYEAYRRLVVATRAWNAYFDPPLPEHDPGEPELLDELADQSPPQPLAQGIAELGERLQPPPPQ
jgi:hypothetical protein